MDTLHQRKFIIALREKAKIGPKAFQRLLLSFGSVENIFGASKNELCNVPRISAEKAEQIIESGEEIDEIESYIQRLEKEGTSICTILEEDYPHILTQINDPPLLLYSKGEFPLRNKKFVAVVGTHHATEEGIKNAVQIGKDLARKEVVVVSGLARGVDSSAHLGAITNGGKTYAVLGNGFNLIYPPENLSLSEEITKNGAIISEYGPDVRVNIGQLMARNRIVVGLSQAVIMVEMEEGSIGTEDAILRAVEQGKPLFVCQKDGNPNADFLIKEGAIPISGEEDLDLVLNYMF
ncbi:MAG TPA: DNA-processing protein DprA [candidate division Zixibacteria bacterium]